MEVTNLKMSPPYQARVIGLLRPLKDVTVTAGETAAFDCELSYEGIPVEWFLHGQKLEPSEQVRTFSVICFFLLLNFSILPFLFLFSPSSLLFLTSALPSEVIKYKNVLLLLF